MDRRLVVGVAGKCCTGKDLVVHYFVDRGFREIDVDRIGHGALEQDSDRLTAVFGDRILNSDRRIDRAALGRIVFSSRRDMRRLEEIVHPSIRARVGTEVAQFREKTGIVINAALLGPIGLAEFCDRIVWVTAPLCVRLRRGRQRDGWSPLRLIRRELSQRGLTVQALPESADIVIVRNVGSRDKMMRRLAVSFPVDPA